EIRANLRLSDPLPTRYARWVGRAIRGDLGTSYIRNRQVTGLIKEKLAVTLSELSVALVFMLVLGVALGIVGSLRPGGVLDRVVTTIGSIAVSMPPMWVALLLVLFLAVNNHILPSQLYYPLGDGLWPWLKHLLLPGFSLAVLPAAEIALQLKG